MILTPHVLVGAAIGLKFKNPVLIFLTAFLSHFILDTIPHTEYDIAVLKEKPSKKFIKPAIKILIDLIIGLGIVFAASRMLSRMETFNINNLYLGVFSAILPDGLTVLYWLCWQMRKNKNGGFKKIAHFCIPHPKKIYHKFGIATQFFISLLAILSFFYLSV